MTLVVLTENVGHGHVGGEPVSYANWEPSPAHPTVMGPGRVEILPL